jgi:dipeptidyl aminopeptidase/acylaminoacyl peptidase
MSSGPTVSTWAQSAGRCCQPTEWSPSVDRITDSFATPVSPAEPFVSTVADGKVLQLTFPKPDKHLRQQLIVPEKITYLSSEGFRGSAYLHKPANFKTAAKFPGMLWIHGGPTSQFTDTYTPLVQFLIQQGYVFLLPNMRGSSGYGKRFEDASVSGPG